MNKTKETSCRLGKVGGEAVLEGVMMKAGERCATAIRTPNGRIATTVSRFRSVKEKHKILGIPVLRGVVSFIETMRLSMGVLTASAEALGLEEEETRFEKWLKNRLGIRAMDVLTALASLLGVALALVLFMYLPGLATKGITLLVGALPGPLFALVEGVLKIGIFVGYIALVALLPDIRRTFQYHGAEHKSIACYESGEELTPENAKKHTRFHPRCGTSFLFVMILLGILVGMLLPPSLPPILRALLKIALLPFVMGIGYEFIMYAGKHENLLVRILSAPGLLMQRLTTREPDEDQLEIAITALKLALVEEFPDLDTADFVSFADAMKAPPSAEEPPTGEDTPDAPENTVPPADTAPNEDTAV